MTGNLQLNCLLGVYISLEYAYRKFRMRFEPRV